MENKYYALGILCGLLIAGVTIIVKKYIVKDKGGKEIFDERQILARLHGFKLGFFTMMIYNVIYGFYSLLAENPILTTYSAMILGIVLGTMVFAVYAIWKDAYVALNNRRKDFLMLFGICGLFNLFNGLRHLKDEMDLAKGIGTQIHVGNFFAAILFGVVFIAFALKSLKDRKETE